VAGIVMLGVGSAKYSQAKDDCGGDPTNCTPRDSSIDPDDAIAAGNTGRDLQGAGYVVGAVGVVAIGAGLIWHFLAPDGQDGASTGTAWQIQPVLGPEVQGLTLGARF
jgi:hypothetical protein